MQQKHFLDGQGTPKKKQFVIDEMRPLSNHKPVKSRTLMEEILDADESSNDVR